MSDKDIVKLNEYISFDYSCNKFIIKWIEEKIKNIWLNNSSISRKDEMLELLKKESYKPQKKKNINNIKKWIIDSLIYRSWIRECFDFIEVENNTLKLKRYKGK